MYLGAMWRWGRVGDILADVLSYRSCLTREERGDCANSCHTPTKYYAAEGKGQKTNTSTNFCIFYYSETTTHTNTWTKRGGDCANSCHTPTKYCAIEGKGQRQIQRQIQRNVKLPNSKKVLLVNKDKDRVLF